MSDGFRDHIATVDNQGGRIWIYPRHIWGRYLSRRRWVAHALLVFLFAGPWVRIGGEPMLLMNILERRFVILGQVFWPQDTFIFALAMLTFIVAVMVFTVVFGRLFCGWICPQTIFMEMVFRPIERLIEGDAPARRRLDAAPWSRKKAFKKGLKWSLFFVLSFSIANTFLAYIIGSEALVEIMTDPPSQHLGGLVAITIFSVVFFWVFARLREQVCTTICPYGRLQGVLIDRDTVGVAYDTYRGEPRGPVKQLAAGDCVDCSLCVQVCPTGIDIRDGLQLECVHCTACIDACDDIMVKLGRKKGLIRYASERSLEEKTPFHLTTRARAYMAVLLALIGVLTTLVIVRSDVELHVLRAQGMVYQLHDDRTVSNLYHFTLVNKTADSLLIEMRSRDPRFHLDIVGATNSTYLYPEDMLDGVMFIVAHRDSIDRGRSALRIEAYSNGECLSKTKTEFPAPY